MSNLINEELETMKYLFGYQKGKVISEQGKVTTTTAVPSATTAPDVIKKIQEVLNTKYGAKLNIDGKWGPMTQSAFESAINQLKK
jgi:peptidoglycan hydrolase-like protein with peptidoglycan-binding domain